VSRWDARRVLLANATLQLLLVVVIVALANTLAQAWFLRVDLSADRLHSLDDATRALAASLDRPLVVRAYFTRGLGAPYNTHEQRVRDTLEELSAYAGAPVNVRFIDPASDPEVAKEARSYGLQPLEYTVREADRAELRTIWMGLVLLYGDRQVVLPALTDLSTLEYELASALHRLSRTGADVPTIGWATGHGEPDLGKPEGPLRGLVEQMAKRAVVRAVPLGGAGLVPEEVDALLVVGPQRALPDRALYQLDQFVMRGGAVAFFVTNIRPDMKSMRGVRVVSGVEPLLAHYGVKVGKDVLIDRVQNGRLRLPVRGGAREVNHPLLLRATDLSDASPLVGGLDELLFPFTSSITVADTLPVGLSADVLARTGAAAGAVNELRTVDPAQLGAVLSSERRGPFATLVTLSGAFRSFYETRPVPVPVEGLPATAEDAPPDPPRPTVEGAPARVVVAGSADFVANNPAFMLNLADWLVKDESLIAIRSRTGTLAALEPTNAAERLVYKGALLLIGPGALLAFGAARAFRRRRARSASEAAA
jgi:gliding-associated putative ABC transporter substrate-binding component GldG